MSTTQADKHQQPPSQQPSDGWHPVKDHLQSAGGTYGMAWSIWLMYMFLPLFLFTGMLLYFLICTPAVKPILGDSWLVFMMMLLAAGVPLAFYVRARLFFYGYWSGRAVTHAQYLRGMTVVWTTIEAVILLSLLGCVITGALMPNIMPALLGFVLFITQWPNATAMTDPTGDEADAEVFTYPR